MYFFGTVSNVGFLVWLRHTKRKNKSARETLKTIYAQLYTPAFLGLLATRFEYVLFALALQFIDVAIAAILMATRPFFIVLITARLFKKENRYKRITLENWLLFAFAFVGCGFAIASQSANVGVIIGDLLNQSTIIGIALVLIASLSGGADPAFSLKLGSDCSVKTDGGKDDELFFTMAAVVIAWAVSSVFFIIFGKLSGESLGDIDVTTAALYGLFGLGVAAILFRVANLKIRNLGINALGYATPVVSLLWLEFASLISVPHFDWLVIGAAAIIVANLLLNFKADNRLAYKALVVSLWVSGSIIYLTDGYESSDSLEVAATIFILILAFRVDRLVRRTAEEENSVFSLFWQLEILESRKIVKHQALTHLLEIDKYENTTKLKNAYSELKRCINEAVKKIFQNQTATKDANEDANKLAQIAAEVDALTHSKQQGTHFGELVAIGFIGGIFVSGLLLFSPIASIGTDRFFANFSSLILAVVTLFLFFNIIDYKTIAETQYYATPKPTPKNPLRKPTK